MVQDIKAEARGIGREIEVFSIGQIVCRPTQKEAEDYYQHAIIDNADWGSIDRMMEIKNLTPQTLGEKVFAEKRYYFASRAVGGYPFIGTPDRIADELATVEPQRHPRHRLLDGQLSRRIPVLPRRSAAEAGSGSACARRIEDMFSRLLRTIKTGPQCTAVGTS